MKVSRAHDLAFKLLGTWFEKTQRVLPWREDPSPYRVWISEIMLQQTQVVTVVPYFERFLKSFPTVQDLAAASVDEVMLNWAGLGYYSRARNIHAAAKMIVGKGGFPQTREDWLELPGVGPYTAGAISSIAGDQIEPILDGNVERVLARFLCLSRADGEAPYKASLWAQSEAWVQRAAKGGVRPRVFNQALMELGATVCTPKNPKCSICPISQSCQAQSSDRVAEFPQAKKAKAWISVQETCVALFDLKTQRVLMRKRDAKEWRADLWDLLEARDLQKWKLPAKSLSLLGDIDSKHVVTRHKIERKTEVLVLLSKLKTELPSESWAWVSYIKPEVAMGSAPKKVLQLIQERHLSS